MKETYNKILIANRGEIAVRIIRACRNLGIRSVAVYSKADENALHTKLANQKICIGEAAASQSYLNMEQIISAAEISKADAIHPGYGFLSENSSFVQMCEKYGIDFIGPSSELIDKMGNKSQARKIMQAANIPIVPGSNAVDEVSSALQEAEQIGFPVMIKASSGGGGKGMRVAYSKEDFKNQFTVAQMESANAFGDNTMYLEKFIENPRHVEIQILADKFGNVIALGERDCSVQRNHQKLIEESPSPAVNAQLRKEMNKIAVKIAKTIGYYSAGTVEFIMDDNSPNQEFYFMEMNTRIQVEHPVTEMITGTDLIEEMILIAQGKKLKFTQEQIELKGHAMECRINAENPEKGFMPSPGIIQEIHLPAGNGVRVDTAIFHGYKVPSEYDSMIAKVIVHAQNREAALMKMRTALEEMVILGIDTNIDFQYRILNHPIFCKGEANTSFMETFLKQFITN